jgi:gluconate kinase
VPQPVIEKKSAFLGSEYGLNLAMNIFSLTEQQLEKIVWRYQSGKHVGSLRGKITWWRIIKGGFQKIDENKSIIVKERGSTFGYRLTDYTEEKIYIGKPKSDDDQIPWLNDYEEFLDSKLTKEQKVKIQQDQYRSKKEAVTNKMIDTFFESSCDEKTVEAFSKTIIENKKFSEESKKHLFKVLSLWCFKNGYHDLFEKVKKSNDLVNVKIDTSLEDTQCTDNIRDN